MDADNLSAGRSWDLRSVTRLPGGLPTRIDTGGPPTGFKGVAVPKVSQPERLPEVPQPTNLLYAASGRLHPIASFPSYRILRQNVSAFRRLIFPILDDSGRLFPFPAVA